jgi:hypothetical protein
LPEWRVDRAEIDKHPGPYVVLRLFGKICPELLELVPTPMAEAHDIIPVGKTTSVIMLAMARPEDRALIEQVKSMTHMTVEALVAPDARIRAAIARFYRL